MTKSELELLLKKVHGLKREPVWNLEQSTDSIANTACHNFALDKVIRIIQCVIDGTIKLEEE